MLEIIWMIAGLMDIASTARDEIVRRRIQPYYSELEEIASRLLRNKGLLNKIINEYQTKRNDMAQELLMSSPVGESFMKLKKAIKDADKTINRSYEIAADLDKQSSDIETAKAKINDSMMNNPFVSKEKVNNIMLKPEGRTYEA